MFVALSVIFLPFLLLSCILLQVYPCVLVNHLPVEGHVGHFQFEDITNEGAVKHLSMGFCLNINVYFPIMNARKHNCWVLLPFCFVLFFLRELPDPSRE